MYQKWMLIVISVIIPFKAGAEDSKIQELEKQKDDLLNQINIAIDDTVNSLNETENNDANLTMNLMILLKKQIQELNEIQTNKTNPDEIYDGPLSGTAAKKNFTEIIDRRYAAIVSERNKKIKLDLAEIVNILKKKGVGMKTKDLEEYRKVVEQKLERWILERRLEKEKIIAYNKKLATTSVRREICPAEGLGKKKKKNDFRRSVDGRRSDRKKPVYPCCRKCCKRSDMGCL